MEYKFKSAVLKRAIYQKGLTIKEFADVAGISLLTLQFALNGKRTPMAPTTKKIANAIGLEIDDLIEFVEEGVDHETTTA